MSYWWEENRVRFEEELAAFTRRGASLTIDSNEQGSGSIVLNITWPDPSGGLDLIIRYPHHFPYFRPAITAPGLSLRYHRSPSGDLCLLPQWTGAWRPQDLVADYIFEQLPKVLTAGNSDEKDEVADIEVQQAEPRSGYYPFSPETCFIIDGSWEIDPSIKSGYLEIGVGGSSISDPKELIRKGIRGAVLQVQDPSGTPIAVLPEAIRSLYAGMVFKGQWVRLPSAPAENSENSFWEALKLEFPKEFDAIEKKASRNREGVVGFLFPEESNHRGTSSNGWVFLTYFGIKNKAAHENRIFLSRAERAGVNDIFGRVPELSPLRQKKIAFAGLGCIGAQGAIEFAKSGIGELRFLEGDTVSPDNSCRWPLGMQYTGWYKFRSISHFLATNFPHTSLGSPFPFMLGNPYNPPAEKALLDSWLDGVDLIFDASAEIGVQHLLSSLAAIKKIPYVLIETRPGGWGGVVARILPGTTGCYYCLCQYFTDGANREEGGFKFPHQKKEDFYQAQGCLSPTFTAASFDVEEVTLQGVRMAVSILCSGVKGAYPYYKEDVGVLSLRDSSGITTCFPTWKTYQLSRHPSCSCDICLT